jgi:hypothetical protein
METWRHGDGDIETWRHRHGDMETWINGDMQTCRHRDMDNGDMETSNGKRKMQAQAIFLHPFAHRANESLSFVRLLGIKVVIRLETD